MPNRSEMIERRLLEEGDKAVEFFRRLAPADWEQAVYTTGGRWRVREVLCHFVSAEATFAFYGRQILQGGEGAPEDFKIDEFNETQVGGMADRRPAELIEEFGRRRRETIEIVRGMADSDFDRLGRHPWFGRSPLEHMLKLVYRHNMIHIRDIRKALETGQPAPHADARPPAVE